MKSFSVKQIADILGKNPETIRRWIRDGKLIAKQSSRKNGSVIAEDSFRSFLGNYPQYSGKTAIVALSTMAVAGASLMSMPLVGGIVAGLLAGQYYEKAASQVEAVEVQKTIEEKVAAAQSVIIQKQALIEQTKAEIIALQDQIDQYNYIIGHKEVLEGIATAVNTNLENT